MAQAGLEYYWAKKTFDSSAICIRTPQRTMGDKTGPLTEHRHMRARQVSHQHISARKLLLVTWHLDVVDK